MAMDFFEHQDVARKKTGRLVVLFGLAVVAIMVMTYLVVAIFIVYMQKDGSPVEGMSIFNPALMAGVGAVTLAVVGLSSGYKIVELRSGGGSGLAESLGGRLLDPGQRAPADQRILNVVEEMSIASGTPVPPVYVMEDEKSINAFAAGYTLDDAVIGISRGAVEKLNRDELQGVVAHEFSHILNGDMRLNVRLIGLLNGILVIGLIGGMIIRSLYWSGASHRRSSNKEGGGAGAIILLGFALVVLGYVGTFFGKWIKSAVSRQREYLADASAVQYTRNPEGIGGALKKIGGSIFGARIKHPRAEEASHMFFGPAMNFHIFATHPPLPERIKRIEPNWDGAFMTPEEERDEKRERIKRATKPHGYSTPPRKEDDVDDFGLGGILGGALSAGLVQGAVHQIGQPTPRHVDYAAQLIERIPQPLKDAAHEPYGARAVIYALLLNEDTETRRRQLEHLERHADAQVMKLTASLVDEASSLDDRARLPLVDMCLPSLRSLSDGQFKTFGENIDVLIEADDRVEIQEWALRRIVVRRTAMRHPSGERSQSRRSIRYYNLGRLHEECSQLLSNLAYAGHRDIESAKAAFATGAKLLNHPNVQLLPFESVGLDALDRVIDTLSTVAPRPKKQLIAACAAVISWDREITVREGEMLRAICDSLGAPMPPFLPGQTVG